MKKTEEPKLLSTNEAGDAFEIIEPLMGVKALEEWNKPMEFAPAAGLDDVFKATAEVFEPTNDLDRQIDAICNAVAEIKQTLIYKNTSYGGAAFKDVKLAGRVIPAEDTILVRLSDKIRRLTEGQEYGAEDSLLDMAGYCLLMRAVKIYKEKK